MKGQLELMAAALVHLNHCHLCLFKAGVAGRLYSTLSVSPSWPWGIHLGQTLLFASQKLFGQVLSFHLLLPNEVPVSVTTASNRLKRATDTGLVKILGMQGTAAGGGMWEIGRLQIVPGGLRSLSNPAGFFFGVLGWNTGAFSLQLQLGPTSEVLLDSLGSSRC